jgi:hypothetical protein
MLCSNINEIEEIWKNNKDLLIKIFMDGNSFVINSKDVAKFLYIDLSQKDFEYFIEKGTEYNLYSEDKEKAKLRCLKHYLGHLLANEELDRFKPIYMTRFKKVFDTIQCENKWNLFSTNDKIQKFATNLRSMDSMSQKKLDVASKIWHIHKKLQGEILKYDMISDSYIIQLENGNIIDTLEENIALIL